jgi:hypothetical protein
MKIEGAARIDKIFKKEPPSENENVGSGKNGEGEDNTTSRELVERNLAEIGDGCLCLMCRRSNGGAVAEFVMR